MQLKTAEAELPELLNRIYGGSHDLVGVPFGTQQTLAGAIGSTARLLPEPDPKNDRPLIVTFSLAENEATISVRAGKS